MSAGFAEAMRLLLVAVALALSCSASASQTEDVDQLIQHLADASAEIRKEAREDLLSLGAAAVPHLVAATESDSALLRWEAVNLLGGIGDLRGTDAVLHVATTDTDVHARWRANWAVTNLNDGTVTPRLIAGLESDDPMLAWNCAVTLSLFNVPDAVPTLHTGLAATGWRQWEAVNALGRIWNAETVSKLIPVLQTGADDVRKEAALSLGHIGGDDALGALLTALAEDLSFEVRWRAAMMLGHIGDHDTVTQLVDLRTQETHPFVLEHIDEAIESLSE